MKKNVEISDEDLNGYGGVFESNQEVYIYNGKHKAPKLGIVCQSTGIGENSTRIFFTVMGTVGQIENRLIKQR